MRTLISLAIVAGLSSAASAQDKPVNTVCPIMKGKPAKTSITSTYEGQVVAFCCKKCKKAWDENPSKYAAEMPELKAAAKPAPGADEGVAHFDTIEEAVQSTSKSGKDIIVDFTGSDWCGWCVKLNDEVFKQEEWKKEAASKFVFVELDYPKSKPQSDAQKKYNASRKSMFNITGYPTILVLDSGGRPYARTGYQAGGASGYLAHLAGFAERKAEIAELRDKAAKAGAKGLELHLELLEKAAGWKVETGYTDAMEKVVELDAKNEGGHRLTYARTLAGLFHRAGDTTKGDKYLQILRELDAAAALAIETSNRLEAAVIPLLQKSDWKASLKALEAELAKNLGGEAGQQVHHLVAVCHFRLGDKDKAKEHLTKALELAPTSERAGAIRKMLAQLGG